MWVVVWESEGAVLYLVDRRGERMRSYAGSWTTKLKEARTFASEHHANMDFRLSVGQQAGAELDASVRRLTDAEAAQLAFDAMRSDRG